MLGAHECLARNVVKQAARWTATTCSYEGRRGGERRQRIVFDAEGARHLGGHDRDPYKIA